MKQFKQLLLLAVLFCTTLGFSQTYNSHIFFQYIDGEKLTASNLNNACSFIKNDNNWPGYFSGKSRVNILGVEPLEKGHFYYLDFGRGFNYYYLWTSKIGPHSDHDYTRNDMNNINRVDCMGAEEPIDFIGNPQLNLRNFKVTNPLGRDYKKGDRFNFEFEIQGNYSFSAQGYHQINLILYKGSISGSNEIGRAYWNREDDIDLIFDTYTIKPYWVTSNIDFSTKNDNQFILVASYANITKNYVYKTSVTSSKPNLKLKSLKVKNTTTNSTIFNFPNGNTNTPTLNKGNYYDFIIEVENNISSSNTANSVSLDMLLNTSTTLYPDPRANVYNVSTDSNIGNVNANSSIIKTFSVYVSSTIGSSPSLSNGSGYTLSFDIDSNGRISESNENDNINQLQFIYSSSRSNTLSALKSSNHKLYEVSVFNISGIQVTKKRVTDKEEENAFIQSLPKGFYIIKNGTETYKVVK